MPPQGVILVYDIANRWSFDGIDRWIKEINEVQQGQGALLVGPRRGRAGGQGTRLQPQRGRPPCGPTAETGGGPGHKAPATAGRTCHLLAQDEALHTVRWVDQW